MKKHSFAGSPQPFNRLNSNKELAENLMAGKTCFITKMIKKLGPSLRNENSLTSLGITQNSLLRTNRSGGEPREKKVFGKPSQKMLYRVQDPLPEVKRSPKLTLRTF
jgi:hypothetical protein